MQAHRGPILDSGYVKGNGSHKQGDKSLTSCVRVIWHQETSMEAELAFSQVKLLEGNFSLCTENKDSTGRSLYNILKQHYNQTLWFDSTDDHFRLSTDVINKLQTDYDGTNAGLVAG